MAVQSYEDYAVRSYFLNVGAGDAAVHLLLKYPGARNEIVESAVLIDGGDSSACHAVTFGIAGIQAQHPSWKGPVFNAIVITHWDADHWQGLLQCLHDEWVQNGCSRCPYIGRQTRLYCPLIEMNQAINKDKSEFHIKRETGDDPSLWNLVFRTPGLEPVQEQSFTCVRPSTYSLGCDLFSGSYYDPGHVKFGGEPPIWPVTNMKAVYEACEALLKKPIFLIYAIDRERLDKDPWTAPDKAWQKALVGKAKNASSVMAIIMWPQDRQKLEHYRVSLYTGADADEKDEKCMLAWMTKDLPDPGQELSLDVVKAGHHGAHSSSVEELFDHETQYVVLSAGTGYGHPHLTLVYYLLVLCRTLVYQGHQPRPRLLATRVPYWLVWLPSQLNNTRDLRPLRALGWGDDPLYLEEMIRTRCAHWWQPWKSDEEWHNVYAAVRNWQWLAYKADGDAPMPDADWPQNWISLLKSTGHWDEPRYDNVAIMLPPVDMLEERAIREIWSAMRPMWAEYAQPALDNVDGLQWVMTEAKGTSPSIFVNTVSLERNLVVIDIQKSITAWTHKYDDDWRIRVNNVPPPTGADNPDFNSGMSIIDDGGIQEEVDSQAQQHVRGVLAQDNAADSARLQLEPWTIDTLTAGLESLFSKTPPKSKRFARVQVAMDDLSSCSSWLASCFPSQVTMFYTGWYDTNTPARVEKIDGELRIRGEDDTTGPDPTDTTNPVLALTTARNVRQQRFGSLAGTTGTGLVTELGYCEKLEAVIMAVDINRHKDAIWTFPQFCRLIRFALPDGMFSTVLRELRLQHAKGASRSGMWLIPVRRSRTILRLAMRLAKDDGSRALEKLLEKGLGPLAVTGLEVVGTTIAEARGDKHVETQAKVSIEATMTWKNDDEKPPAAGSRMRVTFMREGLQVVIKLGTDSAPFTSKHDDENILLSKLLIWAQAIMQRGQSASSDDNTNTLQSDRVQTFDSNAAVGMLHRALGTVMSSDTVHLRDLTLSFDKTMKPVSFSVTVEVAMRLKDLSSAIPCQARLAWHGGTLRLYAALWPRSRLGGIPEALHPYYESTAVSTPVTKNPRYSIPLAALLGVSELPRGLPHELRRAKMELTLGTGQVRVSILAQVVCPALPPVSPDSNDRDVPILQLDKASLDITLKFPTGRDSGHGPSVEAQLECSVSINIPKSKHDLESIKTLPDPGTVFSLRFKYERTEQISDWTAEARLSDVRLGDLYQLFPVDGSSDAIMDLLAAVQVTGLQIKYHYQGGHPSALSISGVLRLGSPDDKDGHCVDLALSYSHDSGKRWSLHADLTPGSIGGDEGARPIRIAKLLTSLVDDEEDIPALIRNMEVPRKQLGVHLVCDSVEDVDDKTKKNVILSVAVVVGKFTLALAQIRSSNKAKASAMARETIAQYEMQALRADNVLDDDEMTSGFTISAMKLAAAQSTTASDSGPAKLLAFPITKIAGAENVPVIGDVPQPFDQLSIVWASRDVTHTEVEVLNKEVFKKNPQTGQFDFGPPLFTKGETKDESPALIKGCHFQIAMLESGQPKLVLDHVIGNKKKKKDPELVGNQEAGNSGKTIAPMSRTFGPLSVRNIGVSIQGKSLDNIRISLDASIKLGPVSFGLVDLSFTIDLAGIKDPAQIAKLVPKVDTRGMSAALEIPPTRVAGMLTRFSDSGADGYSGAVSVSLSKWAAVASGMYAETKPSQAGEAQYRSFFVFGIIKGPIFSLGFVDVHSLTGGYGYNMHLAIPDRSAISSFPFITLNSSIEPPGGIMDSLLSLSGRPGGGGSGKEWIRMAKDESWLVAGVGVKAFQAIDAQVLLAMTMTTEPKFSIMAQATAVFPRGTESYNLDKAFIVLDMVFSGEIDPSHGTVFLGGELTPESSILSRKCKLRGGFALASFLPGSPHEGDFVFTVGGYHPRYQPPAHYPQPNSVARVGFKWEYSKTLKINGEAYFAVIPQAAMGGGRLDVVFDEGWLRVVFSAYADFYMHFHPFYLEADVGIILTATATARVLFFTVPLGPLEFSANLSLHGPPLAGTARVQLWRWSITVVFGPQTQKPQAVDWQQFLCMVKSLPADVAADKAAEIPHHQLSVTRGATTTTASSANGPVGGTAAVQSTSASPSAEKCIQANDFEFEVQTRVPVLSADIGGAPYGNEGGGSELFARPMQLQAPIRKSHLMVTLSRDSMRGEQGKIELQGLPMVKNVAPALWGRYNPSKDSAAAAVGEGMLGHVMGYSVRVVEKNNLSLESLPVIDFRHFNSVDLGPAADRLTKAWEEKPRAANTIPPLKLTQQLDDDGDFYLAEDVNGPRAKAGMLLSGAKLRSLSGPGTAGGDVAAMKDARAGALAAWDELRRALESGGVYCMTKGRDERDIV